MTIILNHTIVPARDKLAAARFFANTFGLDFNEQQTDHFAPRKRDIDAPIRRGHLV
jgi:hypothetical protein